MRLAMTSAVALAATLPLSLTTPATASPLNWPDSGEPMAMHCAAVLHAYGQAYAMAADLSGQEATPVGALPAGLLQQAGGDTRLPDITLAAEAYLTHAESVARTSFYPALIGDGTPYLADDGRELVVAVQTCVAQFGL
ncbi:hypothetical protein [Jannaschia sp. CCS1]|uniref:hypothetical protein n=1 Tax=Jannaschia sp. (strain CCS1) TaxID=290400 RepID=UPI000053DE11|nr:hypothetical protein [Jannaschia sp. CCS1]ABD55657.1 hypothetical protein Jann_2740 [Jannaschia sp. CCS1]